MNMSEDFYINFSCATQWDSSIIGIRVLKEPPRERVDALALLLHQLLQSETDPGEKYVCPICGQEIKISFEYYIEIPNELDISSDCRTCNIYVFFKSNKIPSWAVALSELPGFID